MVPTRIGSFVSASKMYGFRTCSGPGLGMISFLCEADDGEMLLAPPPALLWGG